MLDINTNSSTSGIQNKLGPVVRRVISADTGLNFLFFVQKDFLGL